MTWGLLLGLKMAAREHRKAHDVQHVSELVFGVHIFDVDLLIHIDSIKASIKRNPAGSGHVSHRRTSAFYKIILISASLSSKMWSKAPKWESFAFVITWSTLNNNSISSRLGCFFVLVLVCFLQASSPKGFPVPERYEKKMKCGNSVHAKTSIQRDNFRFIGTGRDWSLFLLHPNLWERMLDFQRYNSPRGWFRIFKVPSKVRVLEQSQSTVLCCNTLAILSVDLRDECMESNEPSVCPKLSSILWLLVPVYGRTKECLVNQCVPKTSIWRQFESILLAIFPPFLFLPFLKWWSSKHGVHNCFYSSFATSCHAFLRMTFHV